MLKEVKMIHEEVEEIFQRAKEQDCSSREIKKILRKTREWANSPEGKVAIEEAKRKFNEYKARQKKEREGKSPIDILEPFMRAMI